MVAQGDAHLTGTQVKDEKTKDETSEVNQQPVWVRKWGLYVMLGSLAYSMTMVGGQ